MSLSRSDRFTLKAQIIDTVEADHHKWTWAKTNILLGEFKLRTLDENYDFTFSEAIEAINDDDLVEMYELVSGDRFEQSAEATSPIDENSDMWDQDAVRLFISHSAKHKKFSSEVSKLLRPYGIHGFVAHDDMRAEKSWQIQIENALNTMQAFVVINHEEVLDSTYCQQEIGWALARKVPFHIVRIGADPQGFPSFIQWPTGTNDDPQSVARLIGDWISNKPSFVDVVKDPLLTELEKAESYIDAYQAMKKIASAGYSTDKELDSIARIYHANDQVRGSGGATNRIATLFQQNGRSFPPALPA